MDKLEIFICENLYQEYKLVLKQEKMDDVKLIKFPSLCDHKGKKSKIKEIFSKASKNKSILICSKLCDSLKLVDKENKMIELTSNFCFSHLICDEFIDHLISQKSYIISTSWLKNWKKHLKEMGFDQNTVRKFFNESIKEIVLLDASIIDDAEEILKEVSSYLNIPYLIIPINLEKVRLLLKSRVFEWRLNQKENKKNKMINELKRKTADYSTVFDILAKLSSYKNKRDIIGKVKELFIVVFGAENFNFWSWNSKRLPNKLIKFKKDDAQYIINKDKSGFYIKVAWDGNFYGILDVSGFLFPEYIDRYLNLAIDIAKFLGLALHNHEQYEEILKTKEKLEHLSFHDSMTGLYNRNYLNQLFNENLENDIKIVFVFDIDKLKYVNDNFGHNEGDKLIKRFADILKKSFREDDIVARTGGDEFAVFISEGGEKTAKLIEKRIDNLIKLYNANLQETHLTLSVSIGYSVNHNNNSIEELMKKADHLMYMNKRKKDNC